MELPGNLRCDVVPCGVAAKYPRPAGGRLGAKCCVHVETSFHKILPLCVFYDYCKRATCAPTVKKFSARNASASCRVAKVCASAHRGDFARKRCGFVKMMRRLLVLGDFECGVICACLFGKYGFDVAPTAEQLALRDSQKLHLAAMAEGNVWGFALH